MPHKDLIQRAEYRRRYYQENKDSIKARVTEYAQVNKEKVAAYHKAYHQEQLKNNGEYRKYRYNSDKKYSITNLKSWIGVIPEVTSCQCCGMTVFYLASDILKAIHFDHRYGKAKHIKNVRNWLARRKCNPDNIILWRAFDFGMLCRRCNIMLPTDNRSEFLDNVIKYHLGAQ